MMFGYVSQKTHFSNLGIGNKVQSLATFHTEDNCNCFCAWIIPWFQRFQNFPIFPEKVNYYFCSLKRTALIPRTRSRGSRKDLISSTINFYRSPAENTKTDQRIRDKRCIRRPWRRRVCSPTTVWLILGALPWYFHLF